MNNRQDHTALLRQACEQAVQLTGLGHGAAAEKLYEQVLHIAPDHVPALHNLAIMRVGQGRGAEAATLLARALPLAPDRPEILNAMGLVRKDLGQYAAAMESFRRAIVLDANHADAHWNLASLLLVQGDFAEGWRENEWRLKLPGAADYKLTAPLWRGEDLRGKTILLCCEQGLGDSIQFIRYARLVKDMGARVIVPCPPPLADLFETVPGIDALNRQGQALPEHDYYVPLLSLPERFQTQEKTIPAATPYIFAAKRKAVTGPKIGIVWRGNPGHTNDRNRSITAPEFAQAFNVPGITLVNLQKDATAAELAAFTGQNVVDEMPQMQNLADTAALLSTLDLVVSVDTAICHLAGAMGVPVWTLIPFVPDWRWGLERADSPWYPTMKLFRQAQQGEWGPVLADVQGGISLLS